MQFMQINSIVTTFEMIFASPVTQFLQMQCFVSMKWGW